MMKKSILSILFFMLAISSAGIAQLSPGDLTKAHAEFEGLSNCTQCHDLGNKVTNKKCLACHDDMKALITKNKGYHVSSEVKNKDCFECHSEHNGRNFDMTRFNEDDFNHDLADYKLEGKHKTIDCKKCHISENISDPKLKKREMTFMGLDQECLSCHDDFHQKTLSDNCIECHNTEKFRPAKNFDHSKDTDYPLLGEHAEVECKKCHAVVTRNGVEFQEFADVAFKDCKSCHDDPHDSHLEGECKSCHTEKSFDIFKGKNTFDHNTTEFTLRGKHQTVDCFECHTRVKEPLAIFQDNIGITENKCAKCHEDQHETKFGNDCARCHQESGFKNLKSMDGFDHAVTDFPLEGKHQTTDCIKCHANGYSDEIEFTSCITCHEDFHEGQFIKNGLSPDCKECHAVIKGFEESLYSIEQHQSNDFPLEGAHVATPCFACHLSEDKWDFTELGQSCTDCHLDQHQKQFEVDGKTNCLNCHSNENWNPSKFNHDKTAFPLDGKHEKVACKKCHQPEIVGKDEVIIYKLNKSKCIDCHS
tara:strand:+ start:58603 stop:60198 length:1596 start_codon:yes stop_codon:yes gene_type:complete